MIEVDLKQKGYESGDCMKLVHNKIKWRALIKTEISLRLCTNAGSF